MTYTIAAISCRRSHGGFARVLHSYTEVPGLTIMITGREFVSRGMSFAIDSERLVVLCKQLLTLVEKTQFFYLVNEFAPFCYPSEFVHMINA